jgi:excisionase family DNA binding protein
MPPKLPQAAQRSNRPIQPKSRAMMDTELKPQAAAQCIGVSDDTIRNCVKRGKLPARRQGERRYIFIDVEDLRQFAEKYGFQFTPPKREQA